jgi:hypothetical protein
MSDPIPEDRPRCKNLFCKSMLVYGEDFENDPEYQGGQTEFWCVLTGKPFGPDGGEVTLDACRNAERPCYQEY